MVATVVFNRKRLQLCKSPLFPGSPSDYRYVPEKCVLLPKKKDAKIMPQQELRQSQSVVDASEIKALMKITDAYERPGASPVVSLEVSNSMLKLLPKVETATSNLFQQMISHGMRIAHPNPVTRMSRLYQAVKLGSESSFLRLAIRYRVFVLVQAHLEENIRAHRRIQR